MPGERPSPALRLLTRPLDALWRASVAPSTAAVLLAAMILALALGLALPQAPWGVAVDGRSLQRWLADLEVRYGAWIDLPARAGLLTLHSTPAWRLLWAALGLTALVATVDRLLASRERPAAAIPWPLLAHAGLLLLLLGSLADERWGWEQERIMLGSGRAVALGPAALSASLERADPEAGLPVAVPLHWRQGPRQGEATLQAGRPLILGLSTLHLRRAGWAVRLRLADSSGQAALLDDPTVDGRPQPEATLRFGQAGEACFVSVPSHDWVVRVTYQPAALGGSPFSLAVYQGLEAAPLAQARLAGSPELAVGEARLRWEVLPFAEVRAAWHPGLALWIGGWLLVCVGVGITLFSAAGKRWAVVLPPLGLGGLIWLLAGGWSLAAGRPLAAAGLLALAWAAATLLLGAAAGLLAGLRREMAPLAAWPQALGWGLLAWTVGGGLEALAGWAAEGSLWQWAPWQACWAVTWCLLAAAWHLRGLGHRWALPAVLGAAGALALSFLFLGMRLGMPFTR